LGINCQTPSGKVVIFRAQQYILCLGGIETSRFLLQPTQTGHCVWDRSGLLGKHFQDHIGGTCGEITEVLSPHFNQFFLNVYSRGYKYHSKFKFSPALQKQHETLNAGGTIAFSSEIDESLGHIKESAKNLLRGRLNRLRPADLARALTNFPLLLKQTYHYKVKHRAYVPKSARISLQVHCEQEPLSQSSISLSSDRDRFGLFRTKLDWRISEAEIRTIRIFTETVRDTLAQAQLASLKIDPDLYSTDGRLLSKLWDSNHHMGGARMSECPSKGVVTPDLRLHAVRNCYVCSAAVFPTSGFSNPTHTVLALAVRLADHLCGLSLDARIQAGTAASGERV
jgi:choline dehydrogenase-like flavoprotein